MEIERTSVFYLWYNRKHKWNWTTSWGSSRSGIWQMHKHKLIHIQQTTIVYYWTA